MPVEARVNACGSLDFVRDQIARGRRFRIFNVAHSSDRDQSFQAMVITVSMGS